MSSSQVRNNSPTDAATPAAVPLRLKVAAIPVGDVDERLLGRV